MSQRERLREARIIRKNRQGMITLSLTEFLEYHNLANAVQEYPERQETML